jgi:hypothetical protein
MDRVKKKLSYLLQEFVFENVEKKMFCRILKKKYGHFDEKGVGGNDVFIKKLQAALVCTKKFLCLSVQNFPSFRLSFISQLVGFGWTLKSRIKTLNCYFTQKKIFKNFFLSDQNFSQKILLRVFTFMR